MIFEDAYIYSGTAEQALRDISLFIDKVNLRPYPLDAKTWQAIAAKAMKDFPVIKGGKSTPGWKELERYSLRLPHIHRGLDEPSPKGHKVIFSSEFGLSEHGLISFRKKGDSTLIDFKCIDVDKPALDFWGELKHFLESDGQVQAELTLVEDNRSKRGREPLTDDEWKERAKLVEEIRKLKEKSPGKSLRTLSELKGLPYSTFTYLERKLKKRHAKNS